jgi:hypothetical protein
VVQLVTLAEIIGAADVAPEEVRRRRRRFVDYEERGLLSLATAKAPRQGGEGLWHPTQAQLWRLYERDRDRVRPATLANAPVGLWLLGFPGIELPQVQRAFDHWAREVSLLDRPQAGERSGYRHRLDLAADNIADPNASRDARRELRKLISIMSDTMIVRKKTLVAGVLAALSPPNKRHKSEVRYASDYQLGISLRYLALAHLPALGSKESVDLWTWARGLAQSTYPDYQRDQPVLRSQPGVGRLFDAKPDANSFVNNSCAALLLMLGMGIELLGEHPRVRLPEGMAAPATALAGLFGGR